MRQQQREAHFYSFDGHNDVEFAPNVMLCVADYSKRRVCVFSAGGDALLRSWNAYGSGDGTFLAPSALALAGSKLFLRDSSARVQLMCKRCLSGSRRLSEGSRHG